MGIAKVISAKIKSLMENIQAKVGGKILELRFPFAGKVAWVGFEIGDIVRIGQELAKLDTTLLSKKHVQELSSYEKIRATFEQLRKKLEGSDEPDKKYLMDRAQADLNSSVAGVEISQFELEQAMLKTPVAGMVLDDGGLIAGMNISPASFAVKVAVADSLFAEGIVGPEKIEIIKKDQYAEFDLSGRIYKGRVSKIYPLIGNKNNELALKVALESIDGLIYGMPGKLTIYPER